MFWHLNQCHNAAHSGTGTETMNSSHLDSKHLHAVDRANGHYTATTENGPERAIFFEIGVEIDTPEECFADDFGVDRDTARRILAWDKARVERAKIEGIVKLLAGLVGIFLERCKNREARDFGMAWAFDFANRLNNVRDIAHTARQLDCTRALVSRYKRRFDELLPPQLRVNGKTAKACRAYTVARLIKLGYRRRETNGQSN
jgi:hypothetical protein